MPIKGLLSSLKYKNASESISNPGFNSLKKERSIRCTCLIIIKCFKTQLYLRLIRYTANIYNVKYP